MPVPPSAADPTDLFLNLEGDGGGGCSALAVDPAPRAPASPCSSSTDESGSVTSLAVVKHEGGAAPPPLVAELLEEKRLKQQRLARKAELARLSRKRKKERLDDLEGQVADLRQELERERKRRRQAESDMREALAESRSAAPAAAAAAQEQEQAEAGPDADAAEAEAYASLEQSMAGCSAPPSEVRAQVRAVLDLGQSRLEARGQAAARAARWVAASEALPARFLAWAEARGDTFFGPGGLWRTVLAHEVRATDEQAAALDGARRAAGHAPEHGAVAAAAAALSAEVARQGTAAAAALRRFEEVLSPDQMARLLLWVRKHGEVLVRV